MRRGAAEKRRLGFTYALQANWPAAHRCFLDSCEALLRLGDRVGAAEMLTHAGTANVHEGRFESAIECFESSLKTVRELGDRDGEGQTLNELGTAYRGLRRWEDAIRCYELSLQTMIEIDDRDGQARALFNLGLVLRDSGDENAATLRLADALAIFVALGAPQAETVRAHLGYRPA